MKTYCLMLFAALFFFTKASAQNFNNIVNYNLNGTPVNGVKIKTNLPFTAGSQMPTITITGFNYGTGQTIGLQIVYYIYSTGSPAVFYYPVASITSFGTYAPSITLANESGKVVIYINDRPYLLRFTVSAFAQGLSADVSSSYTGWTVADETLTGANQVLLPYTNNFTGNVTMPGAGIWNSSGNVGIGTITPVSTLDVNGNIVSSVGSGHFFNTYYSGGFKYRANGYGNTMYQTATGDFMFSTFANNIGGAGTAATENQKMIIQNSGNVGIGTTNTQGYKLAVNGTMIATAVTVKVNANWPDYVFNQDYRLTALSDVKTYIDQNHHLPGMPSEQEVAKDGMNLGEMNKLLTEKVEELTLYLLENDDQLKTEQMKNSKQEDKLSEQQNQLDLMKKQIDAMAKQFRHLKKNKL